MNKGLKEKIKELYLQDKSFTEISKILKCSKGTISYHLKDDIKNREKIKLDERESLISNIKNIDNLTKEVYKTEYRDKLPIREFLKLRSELFKPIVKEKIDISKYHKSRRRQIKQEFLELKGGKCIICGYNKCQRSLQFHHLDPTKKDFIISKNIKRWTKIYILEELEKCILVCANCHGEIHDNLIEISDYTSGQSELSAK